MPRGSKNQFHDNPWLVDANVEMLKRLWADGQSASQIASQIKGATRNAVIGKILRLGLKRNEAAVLVTRKLAKLSAPPRPKPIPKPKPVIVQKPKISAITGGVLHGSAEPAPPVAFPKARAFHPLLSSEPVALVDLDPCHCRWPLGDPTSEAFRFCGAKRRGWGVQGARLFAYCETHVRAAYADAPKERRYANRSEAMKAYWAERRRAA